MVDAGRMIVGWMWLRQADLALEDMESDKAYAEGKVLSCKWFFENEVSKVNYYFFTLLTSLLLSK